MQLPRVRWDALLLCFLPAGCALIPEHTDDPAPRRRGPIPSRVQQPIRLGTLAFRPRGAATEAPGHASLDIESAYSSVFENGTNGSNQTVVLDGEIWTNTLITKVGLSERADVELDLGVLYASNGFLDGLIENYHSLFGFPDGGRENRPRDVYDMSVQKGTQTIYTLEPNELELLDTPLVFTERFVDESANMPALALRLGVDLPTGSETSGTGNGAWDWGGGVVAEKNCGRWSFTGALDWVDAKRPSSFTGSGVQAYDGLDLQLGSEYRWNDKLSLLVGTNYVPPVTRDMTLKEIDRDVLALDVGAAWDTGTDSTIHVGIEEDLMSASGPDITFFVGWMTRL